MEVSKERKKRKQDWRNNSWWNCLVLFRSLQNLDVKWLGLSDTFAALFLIYFITEKRDFDLLWYFFLSSTKVHWKFSANNNLVMFFRINTARLRFVTPSSWVQLNFAICFVENFFCLALKKSCLCKIATKKMFTKIKLYNLNCFTGIFFSRPILI